MVQKSAAFSSLLGGAYALTMRQSGCSFHMRTEGALSAPVSQYDSGQTRAGPNETPSSFTLNGNTLTDAKGRGCWWTPPAMVLQCDVGQVPESGFSVGCDGTVSYNGQTTFYECETGANDLRMIYSGPNGSRCSEITLHADGCYPSGCSGQGSGSGSGSCPGELTGAYQYPHLIIPVNSAKADSAPGTSQFGEVTSTISTAFNFDIPQSDSGKTCNLVFYFPTQSQLETSSYTFSGSGAVEFGRLSSPVTKGTSYSNLPNIAQSYGQKSVTPGSGHTISSFACPAGQIVAFEMKAAKGDASTSFRYFQDWNPCPIGLYITVS
ncbi:ubiquitin 3 binding protein But2 C-terminal domain-containing protein [Xylaria cubensis]|nr:ubiquitin 3 binding protein But2 C-terminal domain-containing protein [Xylaria cubensis]